MRWAQHLSPCYRQPCVCNFVSQKRGYSYEILAFKVIQQRVIGVESYRATFEGFTLELKPPEERCFAGGLAPGVSFSSMRVRMPASTAQSGRHIPAPREMSSVAILR
jgi:hypothetical protein